MPTVDETRRYFDDAAESLRRDKLVDKWEAISGLLPGFTPGAKVLECGAGTGLYTLPMLAAGFNVTSVDLSRESLNRLQQAAQESPKTDMGQLATVCGDFLSVVHSCNDQYDVVTFFKVLHHFPDAQYIRDAIVSAYARLLPGGRIVSLEPNGQCPLWWFHYRVLQSAESWRNERNLSLIRKRLFDGIFAELPDARCHLYYRYFLPGSVLAKYPRLHGVDQALCASKPLGRWSVNLLFVIEKPG